MSVRIGIGHGVFPGEGGGGGDLSNTVFVGGWNNGIGSGSSAILDGGRYEITVGQLTEGEVLSTSGAGRDFPTPNFFRASISGNSGIQLDTDIDFGEPAVGESILVRYFERVITGYTSSDGTHGNYFCQLITDPYGGAPGINQNGWSASNYNVQANCPHDSSPFGDYFFGLNGLSKNFTYWWEWLYTRTATSLYTVSVELRNIAGTVLYDASNFSDQDGSPWATLDLAEFTETGSAGPACSRQVRGWRLGVEGQEGATANQDYCEQAGLRVDKGVGLTHGLTYDSGEESWTP